MRVIISSVPRQSARVPSTMPPWTVLRLHSSPYLGTCQRKFWYIPP